MRWLKNGIMMNLDNDSKEGLWNALQVMTTELAHVYNILALALDRPVLGVTNDTQLGVRGLATEAANFINNHKEQHESSNYQT